LVEVARALNRTVRGWANYFSYGSVSKARHGVERHVYHSVRTFLRRRHEWAGSGQRQFPAHRVFGELGVVSIDPTYRRRAAHASM
jgi:RNA-directed DNA polymerase